MKFSFEGTEEEWESFCYSLYGDSIGKLLGKRTEEIGIPGIPGGSENWTTRPRPEGILLHPDKPDLNLIEKEGLGSEGFKKKHLKKTKDDFLRHSKGPPSKPFTKHQLLGKKNMIDLLRMWIVNLGVADSEQPDRAEYITEMTKDGKHCGSVVSYAMACGGLTRAVDNCFKALGERVGTEDYACLSPQFSRKVAGNIAQVTSILLPPLAQQYELKNPLQ